MSWDLSDALERLRLIMASWAVRFQRLQGMNVLRLSGGDQAPTRGGEPGRTGAGGDSGVPESSAGI